MAPRETRRHQRGHQADTDLVFALYRIQLFGPDDLDNVTKIQAGYQVQPLPASLKQPPPAPAPAIDFVEPLTPDQQKTSPKFSQHSHRRIGFCLQCPDLLPEVSQRFPGYPAAGSATPA